MKNYDWGPASGVLLVLAYLLFVIFTSYDNDMIMSDILENKTFGSAKINDIHVGTLKFGRKIIFYYSFSTPDGSIANSQSTPVNREFINEKLLLGKKFPVIYSKIKPENNYLLLFPEDFKEYNIEFPDSLSWVKDL